MIATIEKRHVIAILCTAVFLVAVPSVPADELFKEDFVSTTNHTGWGDVFPYNKLDGTKVQGVAENKNWHLEGPP